MDGGFGGEIFRFCDGVMTYVREGTSGWGGVPGTWHGHPLKLWTSDNPSPIPELDDDADVNQVYMALHGSKDDKLVDNILMTCLTEGDVAGADLYNNYRGGCGTRRAILLDFRPFAIRPRHGRRLPLTRQRCWEGI